MDAETITAALRLGDLLPAGVWATILGLAWKASQTWKTAEKKIDRIDTTVTSVDGRVEKLEDVTGQHATDLAFIKGKMNGE